MADRRSVFADERVVAAAGRFVPAADETWHLQNGTDPESRLFQRFADQGHYGGGGGTRQGLYVCAPGGALLGSLNTRDPDAVLAMLCEAERAWDELPAAARRLPADSGLRDVHRWEDNRPVDGLVLETVRRDLPDEADPEGTCGSRWNRDTVWFARDEARGWLPPSLHVGASADVARTVLMRLVRFTLVDNVAGQTLPFDADAVDPDSVLRSEVVAAEGDLVTARLAGRTFAWQDDVGAAALAREGWAWSGDNTRGFGAVLRGTVTFDRGKHRVVALRLVAQGVRIGGTRFNGRGPDRGPHPVGVSLRVAGDGPAARVAPAYVMFYDAPWLVPPEGERGS